LTDNGLRPGICSVTYRALTPEAAAELAATSGLRAIEWGADVHAPPDDPDRLALVRETTRERGLAIASYGSYFRAGPHGPEEFAPVLAAAVTLGASRIRIWAGTLGSAQAARDDVDAVVVRTRAAARQAADHGIDLGYEFHRNTLTDSVESTLALLDAVDEPNVSTYWQPPVGAGTDEAVAGLTALRERVCALHVFSWWPDTQRLPLSAREDLWRRAFAVAAGTGRPMDALLEFVPDDDPDLLGSESATLNELIAETGR
jgi:Sugar phosphate isomerases/epimerases